METTSLERVVFGVDEVQGLVVERVARGPGNLSYVVGDLATRTAGIVDPEVDGHEAYDEILERHELELAWALDTHTHVDHVSSAGALAALHDCPHVMCALSQSPRPTRRVADGDSLALGDTELAVWQCPGHARDMIVLVGAGRLFSGDTLFIGGCGRSDLPGGDHRTQWRTLRRLARLPDKTIVHPGHDYAGGSHTTIGAERRGNRRVGMDEEAFVADALTRLDAPFPDLFEPALRANTR